MAEPRNPLREFTQIRTAMGDYVPTYYRGSTIVGNIFDREATELATLNADVADVLAQYSVNTATWGLSNWERICGIQTDVSKPIEQRRSVIISKLRGVGTVTVAMIKNVAESFNNGTVEVTENNASYAIQIKFVSDRGIPDNLSDIQTALRDIIPAHLGITFEFTFMTWSSLDAKAFTWGTLTTANYTWDDFEQLS